MKRFCGMMPFDEIKILKHYSTDVGTVTVQAGVNGWTVIFADGYTVFKDTVGTVESNFETAYMLLLKKIPDSTIKEIID